MKEAAVSRREREIDNEAFRWVVLKKRGPLTAKQQRKLDAWLSGNRSHQGAFVRAQAIDLYYGLVGPLLLNSRTVDLEPRLPTRSMLSRREMLFGGLSAVALAGACAWLGQGWIEELWRGNSHVTRVGEVQTVPLMDASQVLMNTATKVLIDIGAARRGARVVRGEALFTVHRDPRPFIVHAGSWMLRAACAAFDVRQSVSSTRIAVAEGFVEALWVTADSSQKLLRLVQNQEAILWSSGAEHVRLVSRAELERRLAWRMGMVNFDGQSLREAVAEMNRYSTRSIVVSDPRLLEQTISGQFQISGGAEPFVNALEDMYGIRAVARGEEIILVP
jgi:transmembrane sensor